MTARSFDVHWNGRARRVELRADGSIAVDGMPVQIEPAGPDAWRVVEDGHATVVLVARDARGPWVFHDGAVFRPEVTDRHARERPRSHGGGELAAPMPATVRAVLVQPGQAVKKGETLVVLEAMKMELPLRAPSDGAVAAVRCTPGERVEPGVPLVEVT